MKKHADEIAAITAESRRRVADAKLEGQALLAERRACSKLIAEACARHREELNPKAPPVSVEDNAEEQES